MLSCLPKLQRIWNTVGQEDWSLGGLNTNELWKFCFWNSKSFSRPQSTLREVPCGSRSCALLHLAGLSRTPQLQAIFTNHPRNKVCGHACVTFMHPQARIAGALRQTWADRTYRSRSLSGVEDECRRNFKSHYLCYRPSLCCQDWVFSFGSCPSASFWDIITQEWLQQLF